jgi:hypothetical protein
LFLRSRSHFSYDTEFFSYDLLGKDGFSVINSWIDWLLILLTFSVCPLEIANTLINYRLVSSRYDPLLALHGRTLQSTGCGFMANVC